MNDRLEYRRSLGLPKDTEEGWACSSCGKPGLERSCDCVTDVVCRLLGDKHEHATKTAPLCSDCPPPGYRRGEKAMRSDLTMIGFPEKILRLAATGILIEEGEVSRELAMSVADGSFRLDHYPKIDGRVMRAIRKVASVMMTLRSNDMLKEPTQSRPEIDEKMLREILATALEKTDGYTGTIEQLRGDIVFPSASWPAAALEALRRLASSPTAGEGE